MLPLQDDHYKEPHFRLADLAKMWKLSVESIRKIVINEPGVIKLRNGKNKHRTTCSVPASVAKRIHNRLMNGG